MSTPTQLVHKELFQAAAEKDRVLAMKEEELTKIKSTIASKETTLASKANDIIKPKYALWIREEGT